MNASKYVSHYSKTELEEKHIDNVARFERKAKWFVEDAVRGVDIKEIRLVVLTSTSPHEEGADLLASYAVRYGKRSVGVDVLIKHAVDEMDRSDYEFVLKSVNLS